ncbi:MAG: hypothetical protein NZM36_05475 [Aquificaceae bacterium]|nr:hypothetical protein [Aquificaceae bacterium]
MQFLLDRNITDKRIKEHLKSNAHTYTYAGYREKDFSVAVKSLRTQAIVITRDGDFAKEPILSKVYGVIYIPQTCKGNITRFLEKAIQNLAPCNRKVGFDQKCKLICL